MNSVPREGTFSEPGSNVDPSRKAKAEEFGVTECVVFLQVPLINELESAMHQLYKQRASRLVQRRQDDIKDESSEFSSHSSQSILKVFIIH